MPKPTEPRSSRWLCALAAIYLFLYVMMAPKDGILSTIRWGGFFLLTQILVQVIFRSFQCRRLANLSVAIIVIIATFLLSQ